jgi:hypothetical protein
MEWTLTMHIGSGCTTHLRRGELPGGRLIVSTSRHLTASSKSSPAARRPSRLNLRCWMVLGGVSVWRSFWIGTSSAAANRRAATLIESDALQALGGSADARVSLEFFNPHSNPQKLRHWTTSACLGSPRGFVSR